MKEYVVGFLFSGKKVVMIRKNRPDWQAGYLNGVGGHVEQDELPYDAMRREFYEETGYHVGHWDRFLVLKHPDAVIHFYRAFGDGRLAQTKTDEEVVYIDMAEALQDKVIPNLQWILPMAYYAVDLETVLANANYDGKS